jgi:hypothetical protein
MFDAMRKSLNAKFERLQGTLPPWTTLLLLMQQAVGKRSIGYTALLASMLVSCGKHLGWDADHAPHESSFCRARVKFTDDMLDKIALVAWKVVEPHILNAMPRIDGRRLLAIDGAKVNVPRSKSLREMFGCPKGGRYGERVHQPQMLVVLLVDVLTRTPIAHVVYPHNGSEREGAKDLLKFVCPGDILLFDRGFHSRVLLEEIVKMKNVHFIFRMCGGKRSWRELRAAQKQCTDNANVMIEISGKLIPMRSLSFVHGSGRPHRGTRKERMHLLTNLPRQRFRCRRIRELYRARWGIETMIRDFKITLDGENFHARSPNGIKQELKVIYLVLGLAALCDVAARIEAGLQTDEPLDSRRKESNRIAILEILAVVISMAATKLACCRGREALRCVGRRARPKRPNRRFDRKCKGPFGRWKLYSGKYRKN